MRWFSLFFQKKASKLRNKIPFVSKKRGTGVPFLFSLSAFLRLEFRLLATELNEFQNHVNGAFKTKSASVDAQIIILCVAPFFRRVIIVVITPAFICLLYVFLRLLKRESVCLFHMRNTIFLVNRNEDGNAVFVFFQSIVSTAAYKYCRPLFCQFLDGIVLSKENLLFNGKLDISLMICGMTAHHEGIKKTFGRDFVMILDGFRSETALIRHLLN